jgi:DNA-binding NtrC family response regulator
MLVGLLRTTTVGLRRTATARRSFMSTQAVAEEECKVLILGKPGGGKGTISGKIIQVRATHA